jgi:SnoaL-like domain
LSKLPGRRGRAGGLDAFSEYWADDIEWQAIGGRWRGKDAGRAYLREWLDLFDEFRPEPIELIDAGGEQVITVVRQGPQRQDRKWTRVRHPRRGHQSRSDPGVSTGLPWAVRGEEEKRGRTTRNLTAPPLSRREGESGAAWLRPGRETPLN